MEAAEKARNEDGAAAEKTLNDEDEEDEEAHAQEGSPDIQRHLLDIYAEDVQQVSVNTLRMLIFSSMTSLQREEFFELVARAQARRLDEQRAHLKQLSLARRAPKMPAKEELYDMILTTQAQGRLEEQRSRAPGPMDDDDFFSLLLRVQGGRMDEQRTELPCILQT
uniref:G-protein-signaling modulator 1-like n=1 Tax=Hippocampus comes TaxID=109280 RepID=A0A3Q3DC15_HIPCM